MCSDCGCQAHADCVPTFEGGVCDACRNPDCLCEICGVSDTTGCDVPNVGVDRLISLVAFHGRRWSQGEDEDRVPLPEDCEMAQRLAADPDGRFQLSDLPDGMGSVPMRVVVGGVTYLSHPMMVHSWCVQSAFQMHPPPTGSSGWQGVAESIDAPKRCEFAETSTQHKLAVVNTVSGCAFCESSDGFQIFCYGHTNSSRGCNNCNWHLRPNFSYTSFHPSCAVRAGMYRVIDPVDGGSGMMCHKSMSSFLTKVHKMQRTRKMSARIQRVERWLEQSSGFHMDLVSRIDPATLIMDISQMLPVVGGRYDTFPVVRARRVVHKRKSAQKVDGRCAEILNHVIEQPDEGTNETDPSTHSEYQDAHDDRQYSDYQGGERNSQPGEFPNRAVARVPATHSSTTSRPRMTVGESSELIRTTASSQLLEAIDVRVEWIIAQTVTRIVQEEMNAEQGLQACRDLDDEDS